LLLPGIQKQFEVDKEEARFGVEEVKQQIFLAQLEAYNPFPTT